MSVAVMWFRRDLRLADNPALVEALRGADEVVPSSCSTTGLRTPAGPTALAFLDGCLRELHEPPTAGSSSAPGHPAPSVPALAREVGADAVYCAEDFGPYGSTRDDEVERALAKDGGELHRVGSPYAVPPGAVTNQGRRRPSRCSRRSRGRGGPTAGTAPVRATARRSVGHRRRLATRCRSRRSRRRAARAGRGRGPPAPRRVPRRTRARLRRRARPPGPRQHVAAVAVPEVGLPPPAADPAPPRAGQGRAGLRHRAVLAGVLRRRAPPPARHGARVVQPGDADDARRLRASRPTSASRPGARAGPATRSSTPGCASCGPRAGCTTGCG